MKTASLVLGILAIVGMLIALAPFLGWMNWGVIPLAGVGLIISIVATATAKENRGLSIAGIVLCVIALLVSIPRLIIGGGII
jgi:type III secretory pathway component EscS